MTPDSHRKPVAFHPDPRLQQALLGALFLGIVALLSLPVARGDNAFVGWMPLWLLGMPITALLALYLGAFARTARPTAVSISFRRRGGDVTAQARRRDASPARTRLPRAA